MALTYNKAGYCKAKNEYELYQLLDAYFSRKYSFIQKQYEFDTGCIIDYFILERNGPKLLIEIKNWFLRIGDIQQLVKYYIHATELWGPEKFVLQVIAAGIEPQRRAFLDKNGIQVILTKDIIGDD